MKWYRPRKWLGPEYVYHNNGVIINAKASEITGFPFVCIAVCSGTDKKKVDVTGLCEGNSPVNVEFPARRVSNAENVSIW